MFPTKLGIVVIGWSAAEASDRLGWLDTTISSNNFPQIPFSQATFFSLRRSIVFKSSFRPKYHWARIDQIFWRCQFSEQNSILDKAKIDLFTLVKNWVWQKFARFDWRRSKFTSKPFYAGYEPPNWKLWLSPSRPYLTVNPTLSLFFVPLTSNITHLPSNRLEAISLFSYERLSRPTLSQP